MLQNVYSLPDLIDLALTVPEVGAVNFNILHTVLHSIVQELKLTDVRPWCHIENPLIAKTAFTKAKLQEAAQRRIASESSLGEKVGLVFPGGGSLAVPGDSATSHGKKDTTATPSKRESASESPKKSSRDEYHPELEKQIPTRSYSATQTEEPKSKHSDTIEGKKDATAITSSEEENASESSEKSSSDKDNPGIEQILTRKDSTVQTEEAESKTPDTTSGKKDTTATSSKGESASESSKKSPSDEDRPATEEQIPKRTDSTLQTEEVESKDSDSTPSGQKDVPATKSKEERVPENPKKSIDDDHPATDKKIPSRKDSSIQTSGKAESEASEPISEDSATHKEAKQLSSQPAEEVVEQPETEKPSRNPQKAGDAWKYRNLSTRVEATEEGLHRLSNIVDIIADKMRKAEKRKKEGGPASEELEAFDERLLEVEEALARYAADHDLLMELEKTLRDMLKEFEAIKALAALLKQMQLDISKKADKEETWAALALKGDLELVNTKVDQLEFETAIEELGEAIGLLGLKFTRKNDEWEERAAEIWRGIDSKMSRDIFDAAVVKIESRLTALMYGLKKLKEVVQDLLYPQSSGVTRCILCRRPACITGLECIGIFASPKRPHSDKSSGDDDSDKLEKTPSDTVVKRQKLEDPPYCKSRDTIISIPYSSPSDQSARVGAERTSQVPKLPRIKDVVSEREAKRSRMSVSRRKSKQKSKETELKFTLKKLAEYERNEEAEEHAVVEKTASKSLSSRDSSKSSRISVSTIPDPEEAAIVFLPAKLMADPLRRDVLRSPTSPKGRKSGMKLSPQYFNAD